MKKKYVKRMYRIHEVLFSDKERAEEVEDGKETVREVFVGIDEGLELNPNGDSTSVFDDSWIFKEKSEAQSEVDEYNED